MSYGINMKKRILAMIMCIVMTAGMGLQTYAAVPEGDAAGEGLTGDLAPEEASNEYASGEISVEEDGQAAIPEEEDAVKESNDEAKEEDRDGDTATEVHMINLSGGTEPVTLNAEHPDNSDAAHFDAENGVLTLKRGVSENSTVPLLYHKYISSTNTNLYAAIYAQGDLTIVLDCGSKDSPAEFYGTCDNTNTLAAIYGIYVTGELTMENAEGRDGYARFSVPEGLTCSKSVGIHGGYLTLDTISGELLVEGVAGTYSGTAESTGVEADRLMQVIRATLSGRAGDVVASVYNNLSTGIKTNTTDGNIIVEDGGVLEGRGGAGSKSIGVKSARDITVRGGGTLTGYGAAAADESMGVRAGRSITVAGTMKGEADSAKSSIGVSTYAGSIAVSGTLTGIGGSSDKDVTESIGVSGGDSYYGGITVNKDAKLTGRGGNLNGDTGSSYGIEVKGNNLTLRSKAEVIAAGGDAPEESIGAKISGGYSAATDATLTATHGTAATEHNAVSGDSELKFSFTAGEYSIFPYATAGGVAFESVKAHGTEEGMGLDNAALYIALNGGAGKSVEYGYGTEVELSELLGTALYNTGDSLNKRFTFHAVDSAEAKEFYEGKRTFDKITKYPLTTKVSMTGNREYSLLITPAEKNMWMYKDGARIGGKNNSFSLEKGKSTTAAYVLPWGTAEDDLVFVAFDVESLDQNDLVAGLMQGFKDDRIRLTKEDGVLTVEGVSDGYAVTFAISKADYEKYKGKTLDSAAATSLAGAGYQGSNIFFAVAGMKQYYVDANGGRFITAENFKKFKDSNGIDFDDVYETGVTSITFSAPAGSTWGTMANAMFDAFKAGDYLSGSDVIVFKDGCVPDQNIQVLLHPGEKTDSDTAIKDKMKTVFPADKDTVYICWKKGADASVTFDGNGGVINFDGDVHATTTDNGATYTYSAPRCTRFTLPTASRDGSRLMGWSVSGITREAGEGDVVGESGLVYTAVWKNEISRVDLSSTSLPTSIGEGAAPGASDITVTSSTTGMTAKFKRFVTTPGSDGSCSYFDNNSSYYAEFELGYNQSDYYVDRRTLEVYLNEEKLIVMNDTDDNPSSPQCQITAYKKYTIGKPDTFTLTFDTCGKGELPAFAKNGFTFEAGSTILSVMNPAQANELFEWLQCETADGRYTCAWYPNKAFRRAERVNISDNDPIKGVYDDVVLYADWTKMQAVSYGEINFPVPKAGMSLGSGTEDYKTSWMEGHADAIEWYLGGIYTDEAMTTALPDNSVFDLGATYYARFDIQTYLNTENRERGYYLDGSNPPEIRVNGETVPVTVKKGVNSVDAYDEFSVVCAFTPKKESTLTLTLDYNYPDGTQKTHTITGIPVGTPLTKYSTIPLADAICLTEAESGMTYERYLQLSKEYDMPAGEEFYKKHAMDIPKMEGYKFDVLGRKRSYSSGDEKADDTSNLSTTVLTVDTTLYVQWKKPVESVLLRKFSAPECEEANDERYDDNSNYGVEFDVGDGILAEYDWYEKESNGTMVEYPYYTGFPSDVFYLRILMRLEGGLYFDRYLTKDTKLRYNGEDITGEWDQGQESLTYYVPAMVEHLIPENGITTSNEIPATCEEEGSYDEVRNFTCERCHINVNTEKTHVVIPPLRHELLKNKRVEPTKTAAGRIEHWECEICHALFADGYALNRITKEQTVIPPLGETPGPGPGPGPGPHGGTEAQAVTLSANEITIRIGDRVLLESAVTPDEAYDKSLTWESSNEKAATVDENGNLTGVWAGEATVTATTSNGKSAKCVVTVAEAFAGDDEDNIRMSSEDIRNYVLPEKVSVPVGPVSVTAKDWSAAVSLSVNYINAATYTGKPIKPDVLEAAVDTSQITAALGLKETNGLIKTGFKCKFNTKVGKDTASFYPVLSVDKKVQRSLGLQRAEKKKLAKMIKAVNKVLKKTACKFSINKASVMDLPLLEVHAKLKDGKLKLKKDKIAGAKVKVKFSELDKKAKKLSAKAGYDLQVKDADTCRVRVVGKTNLTGYRTVIATK